MAAPEVDGLVLGSVLVSVRVRFMYISAKVGIRIIGSASKANV